MTNPQDIHTGYIYIYIYIYHALQRFKFEREQPVLYLQVTEDSNESIGDNKISGWFEDEELDKSCVWDSDL